METKNISYNATGFLNNSTYISNLQNLLEEYKDSFPSAESLTLNLDEILAGKLSDKKLIKFSEDGKDIEINITEWRSRDKKGKITQTPDDAKVYKTIRFVLDKAVKEYGEKFSEDAE